MKKIVDTHKGFTLAEILISLMILGVIASLTIPSLIQNTQKKDEQVKLKKAFSVLNQAIATDYALVGDRDYGNGEGNQAYDAFTDLLQKRIQLQHVGDQYSKTYVSPEGFTYSLYDAYDYDDNGSMDFYVYICVDSAKMGENCDGGEDYTYGVTCYSDKHLCEAEGKLKAMLQANNPSKLKDDGNGHWVEE